MGLIYYPSDSRNLIDAFTANLAQGMAVLDDLGNANRHLSSALDGGELSGQAYMSARDLFEQQVGASIAAAREWLEALRADLDAYVRYDAQVSRLGVLREDELQVQLDATRVQRDATERLIETNTQVAAAATALPGMSEALEVQNSRLEMVLVQLENDVRDLEDRLRALKEFDAATRGLFKSDAASGGGITTAAFVKQDPLRAMLGGKRFDDLLNGKLSPAEAAKYWKSLNLDPAEVVQSLPPEQVLKLASVDGLPAAVQNEASRKFLRYALKHPEQAYGLMGFEDPEKVVPRVGVVRVGADVTPREFEERLHAIDEALRKAETQARKIRGEPPVQLLDFGSHDGALVAAISTGDLDTASNIGVNVSGMHSNVSDMATGNEAAQEMYRTAQAERTDASYAVVNWIGYRSPTTVEEVTSMPRADSGAKELAGFLDGINANRAVRGNPLRQFNVYAHSYGSTVAIEALKQIGFTIDLVATYGSAGVKNGTTLDEIHAGRVYATHADGDDIANKGKHGGKSLDPRDIEGVRRFSSEAQVDDKGGSLNRTTMHSMYVAEDEWSFANMWAGTVGYLSPQATAQDRMSHMLARGTAK